MKIRLGLIGLGEAWELRYRPALRTLADRFEVRAVCEPVAHRAEIVAREFGASAVDGFRALATRSDVDAILILSEQLYGALPILAASDAGKAVYWAAPLDLDLEQARNIKLRVEQSGIAFMAEFARRLAPATLRLKELIATRLGAPRLLFCHRRVPVRDVRAPPPRFKPKPSPMRDLIELVDWCRYVAGREPSSVVGLSHNATPDLPEEDYKMMSLDFSGDTHPGTGPMAQISCGYYMPEFWEEAVSFRPPAALQVACENGIAFIDLPASLVWFDKAGRHHESLESERPVGEQLLSHFHRAVTSLVRSSAGLDDAYRALAIVRAARDSHARCQRMPINV